MQYRPLGSLPGKVSAIGYGTWAIGGPMTLGGKPAGWGPQRKDDSLRSIRRAVELGVNFFDTADVYGLGTSEEILGEALAGKQNEVVICTKFGNRISAQGDVVKDFSPGWTRTCVERSLKRLRREWLDVLLLHSPPDDANWSAYDAAALERLLEEGKIRSYGVSCHGYRGAENVLFHRFGSVIEAIYNLADRRLEAKVMPESLIRNVGIIARVPLASGFLTGKFGRSLPRFEPTDFRSSFPPDELKWRMESAQKVSSLAALPGGMACSALRFCLSHPGVSTVIPGMRSPSQVEENVRAADEGPLPENVIDDIRRFIPETYAAWG